MKQGSRSNALLVELLIVVLFFMISATVLMQLFSAARMQGNKAGQLTRALLLAQNIAEQLSASDSVQETLVNLGFSDTASRKEEQAADLPLPDMSDPSTRDEGITTWAMQQDEFQIEVSCNSESSDSGTLRKFEVMVEAAGEELVSLPVITYQEVRS